jgi:MYXO-CTERM domain-containing protein
VAVALTAATLALPAAAPAADPGVGEYTLQGPDADNEGNLGSNEPQSRPEDLPAGVRKELAGDPDGDTLAKIATARELGAPKPPAADSGSSIGEDDDSSALTAAGNALDDPSSLALIAAVALIVLGAFAFARRRRTSA